MSMPGNDDGLEAGRCGGFRTEFRRMIAADPSLSRLAGRGYPYLPLRSTFGVSMATPLLAGLTQHLLLAAVIGLLVLAGNACVVYLLAHQDEHGGEVLLKLLRAGSTAIILLIVGASLTDPTG
jgi:hypothetical protein